jgi:hypothetical protein
MLAWGSPAATSNLAVRSPPTDRRSSLRLTVSSRRWMRTVARLAFSGAASATGSSPDVLPRSVPFARGFPQVTASRRRREHCKNPNAQVRLWVNRSTDFLAGTPLSNREGAPDFGELLLGVPELRLAPRLVDSRGTLRVVGALLLKAGGGPVSPFVLASPSATEGGSFSGCPWHRLHWC